MKHGILSVCAGGSLLLCGCEKVLQRVEDEGPERHADKIVFKSDSPQLKTIKVEPAASGASAPLYLSGRLVWDEDATVRIFPPLGGTVAKIVVQPGDVVQQGDPLVSLSSPEFGQIQEDARKNESDLRLAESALKRLKDLEAAGAAPQRDVLAAEGDYARALASSDRTRRRLASLGALPNATEEGYVLRAPLAGVVVEKNINPGQEVSREQMTASTPPLFVISNPTNLWLMLDVTETDLPSLKVGQQLSVFSRGSRAKPHTGIIRFIGDSLDPATRMVKVRASVDNSDRGLKAELYVSVEVQQELTANVQVPSKAVFLLEKQHYVFVKYGPGSFQRTPVRLGSEHAGTITVLDGVKPETPLVVEGSLLLESMLEGGS